VFTDGLDVNNTSVSAMEEFNGQFYIGLRNTTTGGEVWRSSNGVDWAPEITGGLGSVNNGRPYGLIAHNDQLFLIFSNTVTGSEVWKSFDGVSWDQIAANGWGDSNNGYADYYDKGAAIFNNELYVSTSNSANGGEIWRYDPEYQIYLPLTVR